MKMRHWKSLGSVSALLAAGWLALFAWPQAVGAEELAKNLFGHEKLPAVMPPREDSARSPSVSV